MVTAWRYARTAPWPPGATTNTAQLGDNTMNQPPRPGGGEHGFGHFGALRQDGSGHRGRRSITAWRYARTAPWPPGATIATASSAINHVITNSLVPVAVNTSPLAPEQRFTGIASSPHSFFSLALVAAPPASETILTGAQTLTNGAFQFAFTNTPGAFFGVVAATNPTLPLGNWTSLTGLTEVSARPIPIHRSAGHN